MKKLNLFFATVLVLFFLVGNAQDANKTNKNCTPVEQTTEVIQASPEVQVKAGEKIVLIKANVECAKCKAKIEKNMAYVKGVKDINADIKSRVVTIAYDPAKTNEATILKEIQKLGMGGEIVRATGSKSSNGKSACTSSSCSGLSKSSCNKSASDINKKK